MGFAHLSIRILTVILFISPAASEVYSSPSRAELNNVERRDGFCVGVVLEIMEYYNKNPRFFVLPPFADKIKEAMTRHLAALELRGLAHEHPWRSLQDQASLLQVEDSGISERKQCEEQSYPCFSKCLGPLPSPQRSNRCRRTCEAPRHVCASSFACIQ